MQKKIYRFCYTTPMTFPLNVTVHTWIELSDGETTDRYEFWRYPMPHFKGKKHGYIYHNLFPNHLGTTFCRLLLPTHSKSASTGKCIDAFQAYLALKRILHMK